jgi:hypothetical protein
LSFFRSLSDRDAAAIRDRLRTLLGAHRLDLVAAQWGLPAEPLLRLMKNPGRIANVAFLLDVLTALVHEWGIDPKWLLTGEYDSTLHRQALFLGEDRSLHGRAVVRELVESEYRRLRTSRVLSLPSFRDIIRWRTTV